MHLSEGLMGILLRDEDGLRPVFGGTEVFQQSPYWNDLILFYGNFHGDNSARLGASDQTGWTALVARMMQVIGNELEPATKFSTRTPNPPAGHDGGHTGCRPERGTPAPLGAKHNGANGEGNRDGSSQNESAIHVNRSFGDFSHGLI